MGSNMKPDRTTEEQYFHGNIVRCVSCKRATLQSVHGGLCTDCHANTRPARRRKQR